MWRMRGKRPRPASSRTRGGSTTGRSRRRRRAPSSIGKLADVARRHGDLDTALRQAQKAVDLEPTDARAQVLVGDIYEAQKDLVKAIAAYEAALPLEPNEALERKIEALQRGARPGGDADRVPVDRKLSLALARTAGGARRRTARWSFQTRATPERGRDDRHAGQLGRALDPLGHAGGGDGGLSEPHVPARGRGPPRGPGRGRQPRTVAHRGGEARAGIVVAQRQPAVRGRAAGAPELSGRFA